MDLMSFRIAQPRQLKHVAAETFVAGTCSYATLDRRIKSLLPIRILFNLIAVVMILLACRLKKSNVNDEISDGRKIVRTAVCNFVILGFFGSVSTSLDYTEWGYDTAIAVRIAAFVNAISNAMFSISSVGFLIVPR